MFARLFAVIRKLYARVRRSFEVADGYEDETGFHFTPETRKSKR